MIAHNHPSLDNRDIQIQAAKALVKTIITEDEYQRIREAHPVNLYTPNLFIRIGLFLLTVFVVACGLALAMALGLAENDHSSCILMIFWGIVAYGNLELFIHNRGMYQAGVDDALLWTGGSLIFGGIVWFSNDLSAIAESWIVLILAAWGALRYADRLMALVAYGAFISLLFYLIQTSNAALPFALMAVSVIAWLLLTRMSASESLRHYYPCLLLLRMAALLSFYLAGNYYIVQNIEAFPMAWGWLWWSFTGIVPIVYIVWSIRKKDPILLWTGLGLVAAAVFTVRYYYHVMSAEVAMILAGSILIAASYSLIRYLSTPKNGFISAAPDEPHVLENLPVEALILAETFKNDPSQPADRSGHFGGGSGGGAGAGGTY